MSVRGAEKRLAGRSFYLIASGTPAEQAELKTLIESNGGIIKLTPTGDALTVMANPHAPKLPTALIEQQAYGRPIYLPSVVTALIEGDVDLNDDIYIHRRKLQEVETELDAVQPLPGPQLEDKSKGSGRGRSRQPDEADLGPEHRAFLQKSEEQYLSETYINEEPLDKKGRFYKSIRIPPVLPGAPPSKRRTPANPMRDSFFAPPLALSNAVRAADPPDRNYMTSEDFALLMWYTRTIPYCGAVGTSGAIQKFNAEYSAYRWNWARTHGVCLRPLASIQERWTRHILPLFEGTEELPDGNFRLFVAQSGFFTFSGNFIVGYNISAIKQANIQCLTNLDANPELDPYTANLPNENKIYRQNLDAMAVQFGEELLHEGQRWIPDQE